MPEHKFVTLGDTSLIGVIQSYSCSLGQISNFRHEVHYRFWHGFLGGSPAIPPVPYGLNETRPGQDKDDEQEMLYTTTLVRDQANDYVLAGYPVMLQSGEYVVSTYEGLGTDVQEFILTVYGTCMPMLNLTRCRDQDIERYYPAEDVKAGDRPINLRCGLLILIRR